MFTHRIMLIPHHNHIHTMLHAPIVAKKVTWLSFVMIELMLLMIIFDFRRLTHSRTQENLGTKVNSFINWCRYTLRLQDIWSGGTLIVVTQSTWHGISTFLQPYLGIMKVALSPSEMTKLLVSVISRLAHLL